MHTIKITSNLLFEYQCTSGKFIRLPNRIETFFPELECSSSEINSAAGRLLLQVGFIIWRRSETAIGICAAGAGFSNSQTGLQRASTASRAAACWLSTLQSQHEAATRFSDCDCGAPYHLYYDYVISAHRWEWWSCRNIRPESDTSLVWCCIYIIHVSSLWMTDCKVVLPRDPKS